MQQQQLPHVYQKFVFTEQQLENWMQQQQGSQPHLSQTTIQSLRDLGFAVATPPASILAGDHNKNGIVDAADYVVWRKGLGSTEPVTSAGFITGPLVVPLRQTGSAPSNAPGAARNFAYFIHPPNDTDPVGIDHAGHDDRAPYWNEVETGFGSMSHLVGTQDASE